MLNINIWDIVWTVVNLLLFFVLLRIFLFKPVLKVMNEREQKIRDDLDGAQAAREESEELKAQYDAELANVHDEADRIRSNAKKSAEKERLRSSRTLTHRPTGLSRTRRKRSRAISRRLSNPHTTRSRGWRF